MKLLTMIAEMNIDCMSYILLVVSILVFCTVTLKPAAYGRYSRSELGGLFINAQLAWFIQTLPSFVVPLVMLTLDAPYKHEIPNILMLTMFVIHYFQRSCVFPFMTRGGKPEPIEFLVWAILFCLLNGYMQAYYLLYHAQYGTSWWLRSHIWTGLVLFMCGMGINIYSDNVLIKLRKPGETGYKIPRGGMFEYVSGANYFGEIIEWAGFAVASWSMPGLAFAIYSFSNLGPRAYHYHKFYLDKFEEYPRSRKALIPFVF